MWPAKEEYARLVYALEHTYLKRHRIPAPDISFEQPNLPFLIEEILREVLGLESSSVKKR